MSPPTPTGPLAGLKVIELAGMGPGPHAAMLLGDMGADVVQIERPDGGGSVTPPERNLLRRSKHSIALDLKGVRGVETALRLVESADVLIEGFRPGVTERLGLGPRDCWEHNPRLVYGRVTGWGQAGPLSHTAGHDIGYIATTGALHAMGRQGEWPGIPLNLIGDFGGGSLYLAVGVLAAVLEARSSGHGQVVDAAIVDGAASLTTWQHGMLAAGLWQDERGVNMVDGGLPWYDVYETADSKFVAVGALEPLFFDALMEHLGLEYAADDRRDPQRWPALRASLTEVFRSKSRDEWDAIFAATDACVAPVMSLREAPEHPHLAHRATFVDVDGVTQPAPAPRFSRTPSTLLRAPGPTGSDTRSVLERWCVADVDGLLGEGVAVQAEAK